MGPSGIRVQTRDRRLCDRVVRHRNSPFTHEGKRSGLDPNPLALYWLAHTLLEPKAPMSDPTRTTPNALRNSTGPADGGGKIIVDSDWKAQAQREKERLATQEREAAAAKSAKAASRAEVLGVAGAGVAGAGAAGAGVGGAGVAGAGVAGAGVGGAGESPDGDMGQMPQPDFLTLVESLATQAVLYLGGIPDPQTGRAVVSIEHASFNIDLLSMLEQKTKGNLNEMESKFLSQALGELRTRFVEISRAVLQMQAKQAASAMSMPGGQPGSLMGGADGGLPNLKLRQE